MRTGLISTNTDVKIDQLIFVSFDACYGLFCVFGDFYASETQDTDQEHVLNNFACCASNNPKGLLAVLSVSLREEGRIKD